MNLAAHSDSSSAVLARALADRVRRADDDIVAAWLNEPASTDGGEERKRAPAIQLREQLPAVLEWIADFLTDQTRNVNSLRSAVDARLAEPHSMPDILRELNVLDQRVFAHIELLLREAPEEPASDAVFALTERLHRGLCVVRSLWMECYSELCEQSMRELGARNETFVRTLTHELKNPIGAAVGGAQLLREDNVLEDAAGRMKFVDLVLRNLQRAENLLNDLRNHALGSEGDSPAGPRVPLPEIVADVLHEVQGAAAEKGVRIEIDESIPAVAVDAAGVTLILMNLVWNAVKYSDPAKPDRWVRVTAGSRDSEAELQVRVSDNGLGIPLELQDRIFERFFRAHPDAADGTGVGLAITAETAGPAGSAAFICERSRRGHYLYPVAPHGRGRKQHLI